MKILSKHENKWVIYAHIKATANLKISGPFTFKYLSYQHQWRCFAKSSVRGFLKSHISQVSIFNCHLVIKIYPSSLPFKSRENITQWMKNVEKGNLENIVFDFYFLEKTLKGFGHNACQIDNSPAHYYILMHQC